MLDAHCRAESREGAANVACCAESRKAAAGSESCDLCSAHSLQGHADSCPVSETPRLVHKATDRYHWIDGIQARKCRGLDGDWLTTGPALLVEPASCESPTALAIDHLPTMVMNFTSQPLTPPVPPPRLV
jgi:hypothetical protein